MKFATAVVVYAAAIVALSDFALAEKKADTKRQRKDIENENQETEGTVVKEDTKYWSRFLKDTVYSLNTAPPSPSPSYIPYPPPTTPAPAPTTPAPTTPAPTTAAPYEIKKCLVDVTVSCVSVDGTECKDIVPPSGQCAVGEDLTTVTFRYTGGSCETSANSQSDFKCTDFNGGPPSNKGATVACIDSENGDILFNSDVVYGGYVVVSNPTGLPDMMSCLISSNGNDVQTFVINTSGKEDFYLNDVFGR